MFSRPPAVTYRIDVADRVHVEDRDGFDAFARENGAPDLAQRVAGTPLWAHIRGAGAAAVYRALVRSCRLDRRSRCFPFRCDSPTVERHLTMRMESPDGRCVEFSTTVDRERPRAAIALLDTQAARDDRLVVMCAWCHAVEVRSTWAPLEVAVVELGLFGEESMPMISHGVCAECLRGLERLHPA